MSGSVKIGSKHIKTYTMEGKVGRKPIDFTIYNKIPTI